MNPPLQIILPNGLKRQVAIVLVTLTAIVALPCLAVFSMGGPALSFLSESTSTDTIYAISSEVQGFYEGPEVAGDTYAWGNCTYWAFALRLKAANPIPTSWGNANTWDDRALADGYVVDHIPTVGAVYQTDAGGLGHVAYVSAINPVTGDWTISEMNAKGLNIVDTRTLKAGAALFANFIHDKGTSNAT